MTPSPPTHSATGQRLHESYAPRPAKPFWCTPTARLLLRPLHGCDATARWSVYRLQARRPNAIAQARRSRAKPLASDHEPARRPFPPASLVFVRFQITAPRRRLLWAVPLAANEQFQLLRFPIYFEFRQSGSRGPLAHHQTNLVAAPFSRQHLFESCGAARRTRTTESPKR